MPSVSRLIDRVPSGAVRAVTAHPRLKKLLRPLVNRALPDELTEVIIRDGPGRGLRLRIDPQREKYYWAGSHEPHVQAVMASRGTVWDIGAHVGFMALIA